MQLSFLSAGRWGRAIAALFVGCLALHGQSASVTESFTGVVYTSSGGPGLFSTPVGAQVSGTFTVSVGSLGTPIVSSATFNEWDQTILGGMPGDIPANNTDSISATSAYGSFTASNLHSVILSTTGYDLEWGGGPLASGPLGSFGLSSYQGDPPLGVTPATAFPISLPSGFTGLVVLSDNLNAGGFIEVNLTSLGLTQQIAPVVMLDPVPSLLNGPAITTDPGQLDMGGTVVKGISADGIAQVVFRIPTINAGDQVSAILLTDHCGTPPTCSSPSESSDEDGGLFTVGALVATAESLPNSSSATSDGANNAYIGYRAPVDFVRTSYASSDAGLASRTVYVQFSYSSANGNTYYTSSPMQLMVVRPPLVLIHGYAVDKSAWNDFVPLINDTDRWFISRADYGKELGVKSTNPSIPSTCQIDQSKCIKMIRQSDLGLLYNTPIVSDQVDAAINSFKSSDSNQYGQPIAAVQADIVAHSMGGLITRNWAAAGDYLNKLNFNQGYVHKLITIATPHWGTPLAILTPLPASHCSRDNAADHRRISIYSASLSLGIDAVGAVADLGGDGIDQNPGQAIRNIEINAVPLHIAVLAGAISGISTFSGATVVQQWCESTDPVASRFRDDTSFPTLFDPTITATNPDGTGQGRVSDGAVPLTSALRNATQQSCIVGQCFPNYAHGGATQTLVGSPNNLLDSSGVVATQVEQMLNTSILDQTVWSVRR